MHRFAFRSIVGAVALAGMLVPPAIGAQESGSKPEAKVPSPAAAPSTGKTLMSGHPDNAYWRQHDMQVLTDFPWLARFREEDAKLGPPKPGEKRVVFMGDSITQGWNLEKYFPGKPYINRGISGQTSPQMLVRFRQDVIHLKPKVVVILAGTNDIAQNTGPETQEQIQDNIASMADLATMNHIKVVLCSVLPSTDFWWHRGLHPAHKIDALNKWIKSYAARKGYVFVDFHSAMKDAEDGLPANLSKDGVHPLPAGFEIMSKLVAKGIDKAMAR